MSASQLHVDSEKCRAVSDVDQAFDKVVLASQSGLLRLKIIIAMSVCFAMGFGMLFGAIHASLS